MTYKCVMGCDPGASGAVAFYYTNDIHLIAAYDVPIIGKEINATALAEIISHHSPDLAIVESVHAMPKQGVSSSFNFGVAYGVAKGVIGAAGIRKVDVSPAKWKRYFGLSADKEAARALAISQWPKSEHFRRKKDHGRAEAALLALYGAQTQL
jgi:crossover junction endodeoxyribonuclease RuvC